jgi:hypothetical protein
MIIGWYMRHLRPEPASMPTSLSQSICCFLLAAIHFVALDDSNFCWNTNCTKLLPQDVVKHSPGTYVLWHNPDWTHYNQGEWVEIKYASFDHNVLILLNWCSFLQPSPYSPHCKRSLVIHCTLMRVFYPGLNCLVNYKQNSQMLQVDWVFLLV